MILLYYNCLLDLHVNTMLHKALLASNDSRSADTVSADPDTTPTAVELWLGTACTFIFIDLGGGPKVTSLRPLDGGH